MRRFITIIALALAIAASAKAQTILNPLTANLTAQSTDCSVANSCAWQLVTMAAGQSVVTLAGSFSGTFLVEQTNNGTTWTTAATLSSAGTTTYNQNGFTAIRVRCSAFTSGMAAVTISTGTGGSSGGGSSSTGASGALSDATIYVNSTCGTATNCFAATPGQAFFDCTYVNTSPTVTCTASDTLTTSMIGWRIFLTCCGSGGAQAHIGSALEIGSTSATILNINNSTHVITMSANATVTRASNVGQSIVMGPLADTAFASASTAALGSGGHCSPMQIGAGIYLVTQGFANSATCLNKITAAATTGWGVTGAGPGGRSGTLIVPTPDFSFASCTGQNNSCFFGVQGAIISNLAIWGGENSTSANSSTCGTNGKNIIDLNTDSFAYNILIAGWCANDSLLRAIKFDSPGQYCFYCIVDGAGGLAAEISAPHVYLSHSFFGDSNGVTISGNQVCCLLINSGSEVQTVATGYGAGGTNAYLILNNGGTHFSNEDICLQFGTANNTCMNLNAANAIAHIWGLINDNSAVGNVNDAGIFLNNASAEAHVRNSRLTSGASNFSINRSTGTYFDEGGNKLITAPSFTGAAGFVADGHSLKGSCTGVATASQTTMGLYGTGPNVTATTCTQTTLGTGIPVSGARTVHFLTVTATAGGVNASSGVVTVMKNGVATSLTCTVGTGTSCQDTAIAHATAFADGDLLSFQFTTQAAETLAGLKVMVSWD